MWTCLVLVEVESSMFRENGVSRKLLVNSFSQVRSNPCVSIKLSSCTCEIFSKQFHLWATLTNLIKLLEIENDKLYSAMKAAQMASILATLSNKR